MADEESKDEAVSGTVMQCGATDFYAIGRTKDVRAEYPNLPVPTRLKALEVGKPCLHFMYILWRTKEI